MTMRNVQDILKYPKTYNAKMFLLDKINDTLYNEKCGSEGEDLAVDYLKKKGYIILDRNYKFGRQGEIDIIAQNDNCLIFVEVKTRTNHAFGKPTDQISYRKINNLYHAANGYLYKKKINNIDCRFDAVFIDLSDKKAPIIEHVENAYYL